MQRLEVSGAVRLVYKSLGVKGLIMLQYTKQTIGCSAVFIQDSRSSPLTHSYPILLIHIPLHIIKGT